MKSIAAKATGDTYSADEFNQLPSQELQNSVLTSGQTLSAGDLNQLGKAMSVYGSAGDFYTDGGAANAYVLTPIGVPARQAPPFYTDGLRIRFIAGNTNTGTSTINLNGLGVKSIKEFGFNVVAGRIVAGTIVNATFNSVADEFILQKSSAVVNIQEFGADLSGGIDSSAAMIAAAATVSDGDIFTAGFGSVICESTIANPVTLTANELGVLFTGLKDVHVDFSGCRLIQTAASSKVGHGGGIIGFKDCTDCSFVGNGEGVTNAPTFTTSSAALVACIGGCDSITVNGNMTGGRAILQISSDDATSTGVKNNNIKLNGIGHGCDRGFLTFFGLGENLEFNLICDACSRDLFISGSAKNITGKLVSKDSVTTCIRLEPNPATGTAIETIDGVDIVVEATRCVSPIALAPSDTAGFAGILKNVKISGHIDNLGQNNQSIPIFQFKNVGSILENIDLSDLFLTHDGTSRGMDITPDVAATIRDIKFPKIQGTVGATTHLTRVDNTAGATIEYLEYNDIEGLNTADSYTAILITGGAVSHVRVEGKDFPTGTTGGQAASISNVDHLMIDKCTATKSLSFFTSTNVFPGRNNVNGFGWGEPEATSAADDLTPSVSGIRFLKLPANAGATVITQLDDGYVNQIVTLRAISATNTPTIADGGNFKLSAAWAPAINSNLTLVKIDATTWEELSRSDN